MLCIPVPVIALYVAQGTEPFCTQIPSPLRSPAQLRVTQVGSLGHLDHVSDSALIPSYSARHLKGLAPLPQGRETCQGPWAGVQHTWQQERAADWLSHGG